VASLFMSVFVILYPNNWQMTWFGLIIAILLASAIYLLVLFLLGGIKPAELKAILKKSGGSQPYSANNL
jgi:hypothetical protein